MKKYIRLWQDAQGNIVTDEMLEKQKRKIVDKILCDSTNFKNWVTNTFSIMEVWEFDEDEKNYWYDIYIHQQHANVSLDLLKSGEYKEVKIPYNEVEIFEE